MPDSLDWFFSTYGSAIIGYSSVEWSPSYAHYYHVDVPHDESDTGNGTLPWSVEDYFNTFVQYLEENNGSGAAQLAGMIGHRIGDGSNPLHATSNYNPGGYGHSLYESTVDSHLGEINMDMPGFVPHELGNVFDSTMQLLNESYNYTSVLIPYLLAHISWNVEIKNMTEERLRASAQLLADIWYTGMVQAGLAGLETSSSVDAITPYWRTSIPFTITATASAQSVSLYYRYSTDNSSWGGWIFFENDYSSPYSWSFTAPQGDGYFEFYSIARDGDNEESPPAVADARCGVDRVAPTSSVNVISTYWWTSVPFNITATASDATSGVKNVSLYYRRSGDNTNWDSWAPHGTDTADPWEWSFTASSGNGYYEFYSIAVDNANNAEQAPTEADARCGVDNIPPEAPAKISPPDGAEDDNTPTFTWSATTDNLSGIAKYELWVDDDPDFSFPAILENMADNLTTSFTPTTALEDGSYSWRVRAWDQVGNPSSFEPAWVLSINTTIPLSVSVSISPDEKSDAPGKTVIFTVTVKNTGNISDSYDLAAVLENTEWVVQLADNLISLAKGSSENVALTVTIPLAAENSDNTVVTVTATSQTDNTIGNSDNCMAVAVAPALGVEVSISPSERQNSPGGTITFTVTVTNTGEVADTYALENSDNSGWSLSLDNTSLTIPAGENRTTTLTVVIPATAGNCTRDNVRVKAISQTDNTVENENSCIAHAVGVLGRVKVSIDPTSKPGAPGEKLTFTVTVTNLGSATDTFTVEVTDTENWALAVSPTSFSLNAGGSRNVGLSITIPSTAADGDSATITVTATGTGYDNSAICTAAQAAAGGVSPVVYVGAAVVIVSILGAVLIFIKPF